jgi:hypothetical protein
MNLDAVYNVEFIVPVYCNISRPEPAIAECIFSCLFISEVTLKNNWAAKDELSRRALWYILELLENALAASKNHSYIEVVVDDP